MQIEFEVRTAAVSELECGGAHGLTAADLALANAFLKARAVAKTNPGRRILGADTVVVLENQVFGKPANLAAAKIILRTLSGRTHRVITGCVLLDPERGEDAFAEESRVTFKPLTEEMIDRYLAAVDVLDKAGAYALQERADLIIGNVEGSRDNVIGLPTERLAVLFRRLGLV